MWIRWLLLSLLGLILLGCNGQDAVPTNAPIIPPTRTLTPIPSDTPRPFHTIAVTADLFQPTWTPSLSPTPQATRTIAPTLTLRPSLTPVPTLATGLNQLPDSVYELVIADTDLAEALEDTPFQPQIEFEPPFMRMDFVLPNEFLGQDSQIQAQLNLQLEDGELSLRLLNFDIEGALATEAQVLEALQAMSPILNDYIQQFDADLTWSTFDILQGFLRLSTGEID